MKVLSRMKFLVLIIMTFIFVESFLYAEESDTSLESEIDPASQTAPDTYVGYTLEMLNRELGMPTSVHAVRGNEAWQDDVVFVYPTIEVYLFKDRVWQICPVSVYNMNIGDSIDQLKTIMGEALVETEQYLLYRLPSEAWPMMLRINLNDEGMTASFYIYRSDF
jgi:hypothetical protein